MKILYYFPETNSYMHKWQRVHIFDELERNGHQIEVFNPKTYCSTEEATEKLCKYIKTKTFDLFMTCVSSEIIFKETIQEVKKNGLPTLLICFDNLHAPFMHKVIALFFEIVWLTSQETIGMFEEGKLFGDGSNFIDYFSSIGIIPHTVSNMNDVNLDITNIIEFFNKNSDIFLPEVDLNVLQQDLLRVTPFKIEKEYI